jgi:adenosylmethionine-8-amino-7-oxononanoate aminotransferase
MISQDLDHIWYPCSQMKDYEKFSPLHVSRAKGSYIELSDGKKIIDAISSWWCKSLGHQHPRLKKALLTQLEAFEHVILANTTNQTIINLSKKLAGLTPDLNKIFYAGDGSCAVEIALKMSLHTRHLQGKTKKTTFISLENSYHGETLGALSVSDVGLYRNPYKALLFDTTFIASIPYVSGIQDPLWSDCTSYWQDIEKNLEKYCETTCAFIIEPIVQGAGGMKIYSQDFLKKLRQWTYHHDIHLIADECMTGIGRTGKMLACEHAGITPDFLCFI